jgi:hypothetical protein
VARGADVGAETQTFEDRVIVIGLRSHSALRGWPTAFRLVLSQKTPNPARCSLLPRNGLLIDLAHANQVSIRIAVTLAALACSNSPHCEL